MRFAYATKLSAFLFAYIVLVAVPMADAAPPTENKVAEASEALTEMVSDSEKHHVHEPKARTRKPRIQNLGVRQTWTECVGMNAAEAIDLIKTARPDLKKVIRVHEGTMVTMDMRMDRVRVYCNEQDVVTRAPRVG